MRQRRLPADHLGHHGIDQLGIFAQLLVLVGMLVQRQHRAAHGVAGGVVAADDEQDDVAHQIVGVHVAGGFAVRHHRDQVVARLGIDALVPQLRHVGVALVHLLAALLRRFHDAALGQRGRDVRPARQLAPLLEREVEQGRQHLRGQLDRHALDEIEGFVARQIVQHLDRACADQLGEFVEMRRREHRRHGLALGRMTRLVHRDEARPVIADRYVADRDAAQRGVRREDAVIGVDMHDVVVFDHRPIGLDRRVGAVMHRLFLAQPLEPRPQRVVLEQPRRADMKILQRRGIGLFARLAHEFGLVGADRGLDVHRTASLDRRLALAPHAAMRTGRVS